MLPKGKKWPQNLTPVLFFHVKSLKLELSSRGENMQEHDIEWDLPTCLLCTSLMCLILGIRKHVYMQERYGAISMMIAKKSEARLVNDHRGAQRAEVSSQGMTTSSNSQFIC